MVDICITVPINDMEKIESVHVEVHHLITHCPRNMPADEVVKERKGSLRFTAEIAREGGRYNAYCPELDIGRQGDNWEEALNNLKEAAELKIRETGIKALKLRGVERRTFETSVPE